MTKSEYIQAVGRARRIFASIAIVSAESHRQMRVSRAKALALVQTIPDDVPLQAQWLDDERKFLVIG